MTQSPTFICKVLSRIIQQCIYYNLSASKEKPDATINQTAEKEDISQELAKFWLEIDGTVHSSPSGSILKDMARLDVSLKSPILPTGDTAKVCRCVRLLPIV